MQTAQPTTDAKAQIANVVAALADSWNRHDMVAYAAQFTEDADFVNVIGCIGMAATRSKRDMWMRIAPSFAAARSARWIIHCGL